MRLWSWDNHDWNKKKISKKYLTSKSESNNLMYIKWNWKKKIVQRLLKLDFKCFDTYIQNVYYVDRFKMSLHFNVNHMEVLFDFFFLLF